MIHINKIREFIASEKELASQELLNAAMSSNTKAILSISEEIKEINKIESSFSNYAPTKTKSKKSNTKTEEHKNNFVNNTNNEQTVFAITEDLTNKRPVFVEMDKKTESVNSFRSLTETACRLAYEKNPSKFLELCKNPNVNGDRHQYFSKTNNDMSDPVMMGTGRSAVYVDIAKLAINNMYFLKKSLIELGYDLNNIKVTIDPNYIRKPREKK